MAKEARSERSYLPLRSEVINRSPSDGENWKTPLRFGRSVHNLAGSMPRVGSKELSTGFLLLVDNYLQKPRLSPHTVFSEEFSPLNGADRTGQPFLIFMKSEPILGPLVLLRTHEGEARQVLLVGTDHDFD